MKIVRILLGVLSAVIMTASVWLAIHCRNNLPVLAAEPAEASARVQVLMDALCDGAFSDVESLLYGQPDLGLDKAADGLVGRMLWDAYVDSLDYKLIGDLHATPTGLVQNVKVISIETTSATKKLGQRVEQLLQKRVAEAESVSEIYDEGNAYKQSFIDEIMEDATRQALEEDVCYTYQILPIQLIYREGQWWILPDQALANVVCGGFIG